MIYLGIFIGFVIGLCVGLWVRPDTDGNVLLFSKIDVCNDPYDPDGEEARRHDLR